ncbi:uncharacterized protein LOC127877082 isoform X2 [Dreissena polymorpha]|nr:uncharacterized protein LOC127877082 isoform X2 [Dreissena polymorpha]
MCRNHDVLSEIEHDLHVLNERVSAAEKSVKRQPSMAQLRRRFDEIQEQMDEMQRRLSHIHVGASANSALIESIYVQASPRNGSVPQSVAPNHGRLLRGSASVVQANVNVHSRSPTENNATHFNSQPTQDITSGDEISDEALKQHTPTEQAIVTQAWNQPPIGAQQQTSEQTMDTQAWIEFADRESVDARLRTQPLRGFHTVLLLDISESMTSGNSWAQAKTFVSEFMAGLQEHDPLYQPSGVNEHVAIATFGHKTQLDVLMTTDFSAARDKIDTMTLGGPSPLYGGLLVALAGVISAQNKAQRVNGYLMHNKIIVITDGRPTETAKIKGPDVADQQSRDQTTVDILSAMNIIDTRLVSVLYVGVGHYDKEFLEILAADSPSSTVFTYKDGRRLSRRNYLCLKVSFVELTLARLIGHGMGADTTITAEDLDDLRDIERTSANYLARIERGERQSREEKYHESSNPQLPMIGTRVVRGLDWTYVDQDKNGPGTIVGHAANDAVVWVHWDESNELYWYPYGDAGFAVLISDDERKLRPGEIVAVGCRVKPSPFAKVEGVHAWNTGVVIRLNPPKAHVRWSNGKRGDYTYGVDDDAEIELSSASSESCVGERPNLRKAKRTRNKNKQTKNT